MASIVLAATEATTASAGGLAVAAVGACGAGCDFVHDASKATRTTKRERLRLCWTSVMEQPHGDIGLVAAGTRSTSAIFITRRVCSMRIQRTLRLSPGR